MNVKEIRAAIAAKVSSAARTGNTDGFFVGEIYTINRVRKSFRSGKFSFQITSDGHGRVCLIIKGNGKVHPKKWAHHVPYRKIMKSLIASGIRSF